VRIDEVNMSNDIREPFTYGEADEIKPEPWIDRAVAWLSENMWVCLFGLGGVALTVLWGVLLVAEYLGRTTGAHWSVTLCVAAVAILICVTGLHAHFDGDELLPEFKAAVVLLVAYAMFLLLGSSAVELVAG
jgi:hypothetical protein